MRNLIATGASRTERTENLIDSTETPRRFLAEVAAADPGYFRTEQSNDLLYRALTSAACETAPNIDPTESKSINRL